MPEGFPSRGKVRDVVAHSSSLSQHSEVSFLNIRQATRAVHWASADSWQRGEAVALALLARDLDKHQWGNSGGSWRLS